MEFEPLINTSQTYTDEEQEDNLSFCHFLLGENDSTSNSIQPSPRASPVQQLDHPFEFITSQTNPSPEQVEELNEYQKRDYFATIKSKSVRSTLSICDQGPPSPTRLARGYSNMRDVSYHVQGVNISALTSMSNTSKRRMFMFGPVKFKPEMELSEIKQRQARRRSTMTTAEKSGGGRRSRWEVARESLSGRSHIRGVLAKSFGCVPMASGVTN